MDGCQLLVQVREQQRHTLGTVAGEIDIVTVPQLRGPLAAAARPVIADLTEVTFIDVAGFGVLAGAAQQAAAGGGTTPAEVTG
jgi:anti-anti-sigma factor